MFEQKDRRYFLKSVATGGTVALTSWAALDSEIPAERLALGCKVLTVSQAALVCAVAEQIVPADSYPGAKEAGVVGYIDGILAGPFGRSYRATYEQGLAVIDHVSHERYLQDFVSLDMHQQESVLKMLELGKEVDKSAKEFFGLILQHTFQGYYGDPEHGGNHGAASWKMIGFDERHG